MATLRKGDVAPDFQLPDQHGAPVSLKDFRGAKLLLYFIPKPIPRGVQSKHAQ